MALFDAMLANYPHRRHFLQTVNLPAFDPPQRRFLYMKMHKAACTTVLATLMKQLAATKNIVEELSMERVHAPPQSLLLTGPRGVSNAMVEAAVQSDDVFKFTIVREPVARTVSAWADKVDVAGKQRANLMAYLGRPADAPLSLSAFIDILAHDEGARDLDRHWRSQRLEMSYDQIPYDYVGVVEDMAPAMAHITAVIFGAEAADQIEDTRRSFGHQTTSRSWRDTLTAQDVKNLEAAFGADLDMYEQVTRRLRGQR
ncbi:sulfotransferase family 2 domain-containing protein [Celeribacter sp.]|uniref:sulfotransferase family 2 domain-containing protein n=1 Tax=Celeribacter sp. TaxID=1890673 RepID=UPI003A906FDB